jgi:predicted Zn-dependent protease with MMP-like domain
MPGTYPAIDARGKGPIDNPRPPPSAGTRMDPADFDALVAEALDGIPEEFARHLANVSVVVADEPDEEGLYGLYEGVPLSERGHDFGALPDRISIYRGPLLRDFRGRAAIRRQVRLTILHEIAHFFGLDERRIRRLGY